jgi:hypothetical protein
VPLLSSFARSAIVAGLLTCDAGLLCWTALQQSPTLNEPAHLVAGLSNWRFRVFSLYNANPPLVRVIAAIPVLSADPEMDWKLPTLGPRSRPEFLLGEEFIAANGKRSFWFITTARWVCIPFSLLGGYLCFRWSRDLYGPTSGQIALALWCFCPNLLAHGSLITSDATATALGVAACYTFWRWLRHPTWRHTIVSGTVLGIAELTKTTLVIFYPLWPILWAVYRWGKWRQTSTTAERNPADGSRSEPAALAPLRGERRKRILRELGMLVVRMMIGIYVINLGYGFEGSCTRLEEFRFVSNSLGGEGAAKKAPVDGGNQFSDSWLASLPVPLPRNYVLGIDLQRRDFEDYPQPSYLRGAFQGKGWWYYYLYALAIKVPLGTWLLILLAATRGIWWRAPSPSVPLPSREREREKVTWRDEFILLAPAIIILAFVSSQTGFSEHMRYVLPIFPFFFVWISRVAVVFDGSSGREARGGEMMDGAENAEGSPTRLARPTIDFATWRRRLFGGLIIASLAWSIISSLSVYPHSLSYFNELVGPTGGPKHLIHSNVDWGQDLLFLKKWLDQHPEAKPLKLAYFGYFDPKYADIEYSAPEVPAVGEGEDPIDAPIPSGWYAISVNFVQGLPYFSYKGDGKKVSYGLKELARFQRLKPVAMAGYSIYIYHVE